MVKAQPESSSTTRRRTSIARRPIFAIITILIITAIIVCLAFILSRSGSAPSSTMESSQSQDTGATSSSSTSASTTSSEPAIREDIKDIPVSDGSSANQLDYLTGNITSISQANQTLSIRVGINQFLSDGTCELILTSSSGQSYTQSTTILPDPSSSYCDGFDIPLNALSAGTYQIKINLTSGDRTGVIEGSTTL